MPPAPRAEDLVGAEARAGRQRQGRHSGADVSSNGVENPDSSRYVAKGRRFPWQILKPAEKVFWGGYSGYFADPDGYAWEVAFNPYWPLDQQGLPQLP